MQPTIYNDDHRMFREAFRTFVAREVKPNQERWAEVGMVDRETWRSASVVVNPL